METQHLEAGGELRDNLPRPLHFPDKASSLQGGGMTHSGSPGLWVGALLCPGALLATGAGSASAVREARARASDGEGTRPTRTQGCLPKWVTTGPPQAVSLPSAPSARWQTRQSTAPRTARGRRFSTTEGWRSDAFFYAFFYKKLDKQKPRSSKYTISLLEIDHILPILE